MTANSVFLAAISYTDAGLSVIPIAADGSKRPAVPWAEYQTRIADRATLKEWFQKGRHGIGIIGGAVSGNLERIDFDLPGIYGEWLDLCQKCEYAGLIETLPLVRTPRSETAYHVYYRCEAPVDGNKILARYIESYDPNGAPNIKASIETRGEGGYTLAPGSPPECHDTGREYVLVQGDLENIPIITKDQRDALLELARSFNEYEEGRLPQEERGADEADTSRRPGDEYNERGDWRELITGIGWVYCFNRGDTEYWRRPGKSRLGISATFNYKRAGVFYVFSSNAHPFQMERSYFPFGIYTLLNHNGDYSESAKALLNTGFGKTGTFVISSGRRKKIDEQIARAKEEGTAKAVHGIVGALAELDHGELTDILSDLKEWIPQLDLRLIKGDITRERKRAFRRASAGEHIRLVVNNRQLRDMGDEALQILFDSNVPPTLFVRGGEICHISTDENDHAKIAIANESEIISRLAKICNSVAASEDGERNVAPPRIIAEYIMAEPRYPFPPLLTITTAPPVRADGSFSSVPGYDPETRLYYHQKTECKMPPVSDNPGAAEVRTAVDLLMEVICDFSFDSEASKANAIAMIMTPILRPTFGGLPQAAIIDAPKQKSGKGLLSQVTAIIATGEQSPVTTAPLDENEWNKLITSKLLEGPSILIFDNIKHTVGGQSIEAVLTATEWEARVLGASKTVRLPNKAFYIFNGNNIHTTDDMATRIFLVRIDPKCANPEERDGFRHPRLLKWVARHRGETLSAIITLYRAWVTAGKPESPEVPIVGAYEEWALVIGNVLTHCGIAGFLGNRKKVKDKLSVESPQWEAFLTEWFTRYMQEAVTVNQIFSDITTQGYFVNTVPADLARALDAKSDQGKRVNIGRVFGNRCETRFGIAGLYLFDYGTSHQTKLWKLEVDHPELLEFGGDRGDKGDIPIPHDENDILPHGYNVYSHGTHGEISPTIPLSPPTPEPRKWWDNDDYEDNEVRI